MILRSLLIAAVLLIPVSSVQAETQPQQLDKSDPNYVRCRKIQVTGSFVKKEKVCKTNAEWQRLADFGNDEARSIFQRNLESSSTNGN